MTDAKILHSSVRASLRQSPYEKEASATEEITLIFSDSLGRH